MPGQGGWLPSQHGQLPEVPALLRGECRRGAALSNRFVIQDLDINVIVNDLGLQRLASRKSLILTTSGAISKNESSAGNGRSVTMTTRTAMIKMKEAMMTMISARIRTTVIMPILIIASSIFTATMESWRKNLPVQLVTLIEASNVIKNS